MTELKNGEGTPAEGAQLAEKPASEIDALGKLVELERELSKQLEEKENYKQAALSKEEELKKVKAQIKALTESPVEIKPQEVTPVPPVISEEPKVVETTGYNPEKEAKAQFLKMYPGVNMEKILEHYRGGKYETVVEYISALEDAKSYSDWKTGNTSSINLPSQGSGVSEVEGKTSIKVTYKDKEIADKYFGGNLERYLKVKNK